MTLVIENSIDCIPEISCWQSFREGSPRTASLLLYPVLKQISHSWMYDQVKRSSRREQIFTFIRPVVKSAAPAYDWSSKKHFISCDWRWSCRKASRFQTHLCSQKKLTWIRQRTCPTAPGLLLRRRSSSLPATPSCRGTPGSLSESQKKRLYTSTTSAQLEHHSAGSRATSSIARCYLQDFVGLQSQRVKNLRIEEVLQGRVPAVDVVTEKRQRGWGWNKLIKESDEQQLPLSGEFYSLTVHGLWMAL